VVPRDFLNGALRVRMSDLGFCPCHKQRSLMREFEKHVIDAAAHEFPMLWWYRIIPYRLYVKGWKINPSHYLNQDLATVWLDK